MGLPASNFLKHNTNLELSQRNQYLNSKINIWKSWSKLLQFATSGKRVILHFSVFSQKNLNQAINSVFPNAAYFGIFSKYLRYFPIRNFALKRSCAVPFSAAAAGLTQRQGWPQTFCLHDVLELCLCLYVGRLCLLARTATISWNGWTWDPSLFDLVLIWCYKSNTVAWASSFSDLTLLWCYKLNV